MLANLENSRLATGLEKVSFHSDPTEIAVPKNLQTTVQLHSFPMLVKICSNRLQRYINQELPYEQAGFRKDRGTRNQIANIYGIIEKACEFRKISTSASLTTLKPLTIWITINCGKFLEMGIPDLLTCLLRNLYVGQEAIIRTLHETTDWFQIGKRVQQGSLLSPHLFNLYASRVHHEKCQAGWLTSWNQDCQEKYQQSQICRWCHSKGRKWVGI